ncbi:MAG: hypothetical protein KJO37_00250 [Bacteroidia bacterium]|nr:hypothetical protein [Bacteroidia bacterium]
MLKTSGLFFYYQSTSSLGSGVVENAQTLVIFNHFVGNFKHAILLYGYV